MRVRLRNIIESDLPVFHEQMRDPEAQRMAAHTPREAAAFYAHWHKIMADSNNQLRTIVDEDDAVLGHVACWPAEGEHRVGYWVARECWGRGVASAALAQFLNEFPRRPLHAYVARSNAGSIRVLEKCGFIRDEAATAAQPPPMDGVQEFVYLLNR